MAQDEARELALTVRLVEHEIQDIVLNVRVSDRLYSELKRFSEASRLPVSWLIRQALERYLRELGSIDGPR